MNTPECHVPGWTCKWHECVTSCNYIGVTDGSWSSDPWPIWPMTHFLLWYIPPIYSMQLTECFWGVFPPLSVTPYKCRRQIEVMLHDCSLAWLSAMYFSILSDIQILFDTIYRSTWQMENFMITNGYNYFTDVVCWTTINIQDVYTLQHFGLKKKQKKCERVVGYIGFIRKPIGLYNTIYI